MRVAAIRLLSLSLLCPTFIWAVEPANPTTVEAASPTSAPATPTIQTLAAGKPNNMTAANLPNAEKTAVTPDQAVKTKLQQDARIKAVVKDQELRLQQLEKANLEALAQNQELQLKNDSLGVQVQVLQSERSAQMFLYGATTLAVGVLLGFLLASYVYTKRRRQW